MVEQITVWEDSNGVLHKTEQEAIDAEAKYAKKNELRDVVGMLQTRSRALGYTGLPTSVEQAAKVAIAVYPDLKAYYGD